jgi:peptidyl-prolyl cis-trans isomerase D
LPAIENAIAKLDSGQISQVVKTDFGFHIIKVEVHERPGPASLTPDIAAAIRNKLSTEKAKSHFQEWVENDLVKEHHIEAFY